MGNWLSSSEQQNNKIHFMLDPSVKTSNEDIARAQKLALEKDLRTAELMEGNNSDVKIADDAKLYPCNTTVIVLPYDKNPYRRVSALQSSGLYVPGQYDNETFTSPDSGEIENNKRGIWCCKVIAIGPKCENVRVGDDVFVNFLIANPFPFGGKGYYALSEMNIIASIRNE